MPKNFQIKSQFLRYFLVFYGKLSFHLTQNQNKLYSLLWQFYHLFHFGLFFWVTKQPDSVYEKNHKEASNGLPLVKLSFRVFVTIFSLTFALTEFYCLRFGPKIVQTLDQLHVLSEREDEPATVWTVGGLLFFDHMFFYMIFLNQSVYYNLNFTKQNFFYNFFSLFVEYVFCCQSTIFFRFLAYGKWAIWRVIFECNFRQKNYKLTKQKLLKLVQLNQKLSILLSLPLFCELVQHCLSAIWSLCFTSQKISKIQLLSFLFPILNIFLIDWFSKKASQSLDKLSKQIVVNQLKNKNLILIKKHQNQKIYWYQVPKLYGDYFNNFKIFSIIFVDATFGLNVVLLITNYALLINQTT